MASVATSSSSATPRTIRSDLFTRLGGVSGLRDWRSLSWVVVSELVPGVDAEFVRLGYRASQLVTMASRRPNASTAPETRVCEASVVLALSTARGAGPRPRRTEAADGGLSLRRGSGRVVGGSPEELDSAVRASSNVRHDFRYSRGQRSVVYGRSYVSASRLRCIEISRKRLLGRSGNRWCSIW